MRELIANSANRVQNKMFMLTYEPKEKANSIFALNVESGPFP